MSRPNMTLQGDPATHHWVKFRSFQAYPEITIATRDVWIICIWMPGSSHCWHHQCSSPYGRFLKEWTRFGDCLVSAMLNHHLWGYAFLVHNMFTGVKANLRFTPSWPFIWPINHPNNPSLQIWNVKLPSSDISWVSTDPHEAKEDPKMQVKQLEALSDLVLKYPATWFVDGWSVTLKFG